MTIDENIKILNQLERTLAPTMAASGIDALKLGIEALKAVKKYRAQCGYTSDDLLPGETEK